HTVCTLYPYTALFRSSVVSECPDRRTAPTHLPEIGLRPAEPKRLVAARAAVGDRCSNAVVEHSKSGPLLPQARIYAARMIDIEIVGGDALIDDQHDVPGRRRA